MDTLINETHTSPSMTVFHNFANYTAEQVPALFLPWYVSVDAVNNDLHDATWNPFTTFFPQFWTCSTATCGTK
jgi:hypothetical protein